MDCPGSEDRNLDGANCGQCAVPAPANQCAPEKAPGRKKRRNKNRNGRAASQNGSAQNGSAQNDHSKNGTALNDKDNSAREKKGAALKLLQTMSVWLEGTDCPTTEDTVLTGWSARYAEQFDREEEPEKVDLAPLLGLPEGTDREELARIAEEQEEDLLKQLIG